MTVCKSCGANIRWIKLKTGKWHPVDNGRIPYVPDKNGGYLLVTEDGELVRGEFDMHSQEYGYMSHFASCPHADDWRKKK